MVLQLSNIQLEKFSPLVQARCALPGGEGKGEGGEEGWGPRKEVTGQKGVNEILRGGCDLGTGK